MFIGRFVSRHQWHYSALITQVSASTQHTLPAVPYTMSRSRCPTIYSKLAISRPPKVEGFCFNNKRTEQHSTVLVNKLRRLSTQTSVHADESVTPGTFHNNSAPSHFLQEGARGVTPLRLKWCKLPSLRLLLSCMMCLNTFRP